jgi:hemerythrin superfamily protein
MEFKIPQPIKTEHNELHNKLAEATKMSGNIGEAANRVAKLLHPHFVKEEEYALPPLGLLSLIAEGKIYPDMQKIIDMTEKLKSELKNMLEEHKTITLALETLKSIAQKENRNDIVKFADELVLHAQTEEEVLYPTSILIGEYIKLKLNI